MGKVQYINRSLGDSVLNRKVEEMIVIYGRGKYTYRYSENKGCDEEQGIIERVDSMSGAAARTGN